MYIYDALAFHMHMCSVPNAHAPVCMRTRRCDIYGSTRTRMHAYVQVRRFRRGVRDVAGVRSLLHTGGVLV